MSGELLNPHDHDRGLRNEERINDLERRLTDYVTSHERIHILEAEARALALAALQSQTRLILAALGLLITLAIGVTTVVVAHG